MNPFCRIPRFAIAIVIIPILVALAACDRGDSGAPPFSGQRLHDFGEVDFEGLDMSIEHEFILSNTTNTTIEIEKLAPTCGCVTPEANSMSIAPGGELRITTAMKMKEPGQKREHIDVVLKQGRAPVRLSLEAVARMVKRLGAVEPSITLTPDEPGILTLQVRTTIPDWLPPSPYFNEFYGMLIEFDGWESHTTETSTDEAEILWRGVMRFTLTQEGLSLASTPTNDAATTRQEMLVVRVGHSNEIEVPLKVKP
jgi:hypothetical protein